MNLKTKWIYRLGNPNAEYRLFCFAYAGSDALTVFRPWFSEFGSQAEVCAVQLPGRGTRMAEPSFTSIQPAAEAVANAISVYRDKPFAFFGHSMGAKLAFEVARLLKIQYGVEPFMLSVSGAKAPQCPYTEPLTHDLPEEEFVSKLESLKGTPPEVLANKELMQLLLPVLRADFQACETYINQKSPILHCPIVVLGGSKDRCLPEELEAWRHQTHGRFSLEMFEGDHFFFKTHQAEVVRFLNSRLNENFPSSHRTIQSNTARNTVPL